EVEALAHAAAKRGSQVGELLVLEHLGKRHPLGVHYFAAERQNRLLGAVAPLLGRSARRIAFDDEQLAVITIGSGAITELAGQIQTAARGGSARDLGLRGPACFPRARRQDD